MNRTGNPAPPLLLALAATAFLAACGGGGAGGDAVPPHAGTDQETPGSDVGDGTDGTDPDDGDEAPGSGNDDATPDADDGQDPDDDAPDPDAGDDADGTTPDSDDATPDSDDGQGPGDEETPDADDETGQAPPLLDADQVAWLIALVNGGPPEAVTEEEKRRRADQERPGWQAAWIGEGDAEARFGQLEGWAIDHWNGSGPRDDRHGILARNGLTLAGNRTGDARAVWVDMDHADIFVFTTPALGGSVYAEARGVPAGGAPSSGATWQGLMIGADNATLELLTGDAAIGFDFGAMTVEAAFTDIVNIDRMAAHAVPSVRFVDVPVLAGRGYAHAEGPEVEILVDFIGPGHAAAVGRFEADGMTATFGATR